MKRPRTRPRLERLESRETPSTSADAPYLTGSGLDLAVTNVHYAGVHSSQPITGTVTVTNPPHATGKFDVVAVWAEGVDSQNHPTGRTEVAGTDTEVITRPNAGSKHGQGFKVYPADPAPPSWAHFLVAEVNPGGQVPETRADNNVFAIPVSAPAGDQSAAPAPPAASPGSTSTGSVVGTLNDGAAAILDAGVAAATNGVSDAVVTLNDTGQAVFDATAAAATNGVDDAVHILNNGSQAIFDAGTVAVTDAVSEDVDMLNNGSQAVIDAGTAAATSGVGEAVDLLDNGAQAVSDAIASAATNGVGDAVDVLNNFGHLGLDLLPHGFGAQATATTTTGNGTVGAGSTSSLGVGGFYDTQQGWNAGEFASGGIFVGGPNGSDSRPPEPDPVTGNFSAGAYTGAGLSVFLTNAQNVGNLAGPFHTWSLDVGEGVQLFGGQFQWGYDHGQPIWVLSLGVPGWGIGSGAAVSGYQTETVTHPINLGLPPAAPAPTNDVPGMELSVSPGADDEPDPLLAIEQHLNSIPIPVVATPAPTPTPQPPFVMEHF